MKDPGSYRAQAQWAAAAARRMRHPAPVLVGMLAAADRAAALVPNQAELLAGPDFRRVLAALLAPAQDQGGQTRRPPPRLRSVGDTGNRPERESDPAAAVRTRPQPRMASAAPHPVATGTASATPALDRATHIHRVAEFRAARRRELGLGPGSPPDARPPRDNGRPPSAPEAAAHRAAERLAEFPVQARSLPAIARGARGTPTAVEGTGPQRKDQTAGSDARSVRSVRGEEADPAHRREPDEPHPADSAQRRARDEAGLRAVERSSFEAASTRPPAGNSLRTGAPRPQGMRVTEAVLPLPADVTWTAARAQPRPPGNADPDAGLRPCASSPAKRDGGPPLDPESSTAAAPSARAVRAPRPAAPTLDDGGTALEDAAWRHGVDGG